MENGIDKYWDVRRLMTDAKSIYYFLEKSIPEARENASNLHGIIGFGGYDRSYGMNMAPLVLMTKVGRIGEDQKNLLPIHEYEMREYFIAYLNENMEDVLSWIADKMMQDAKKLMDVVNQELKEAKSELDDYLQEIESRNL